MKYLQIIINIFLSIKNFITCFLRSNCEYSIKKLLAFFFTGLIFYLAIFTEKDTLEYLIFLGALLGLREYAKQKYFNSNGETK